MRAQHLRVFECTFCQNAPIDAARISSRSGSSGFMVFWSLVIIVTAIACAALYYAARGRPVNAAGAVIPDLTTAHFRLQLSEIEADAASGRLGEAEAQAARGELAREMLRIKGEGAGKADAATRRRNLLLPLSVVVVAVVALGAYSFLGSPQLPSLPLASRPDTPPAQIDLDDAIARIEAQLAGAPDDLRGWSVIAPAYMQLGRFADAARAYRRILELGGATADSETDLGEALMMANGGSAAGEPLALFTSAAARDARHVRSRYYLASEATRTGDYESAIGLWNGLLALAQGDEPWVAAARGGLAMAEAGLAGAAQPDAAAIEGMVEGLAARLAAEGGTIEDWTRLVRSRLVLGQTERAQADYDAARRAYPDAAVRTELDVLAADNGLLASEATN
jgi:cytochrome c-type biogenesis protein CcmH